MISINQIEIIETHGMQIPSGKMRTEKKKIPVPVVTNQYLDNTIEQSEFRMDADNDMERILNQGYGLERDGFLGTTFSPKPRFEMIPEFPEHLKKKGIQGRIKFQLLINTSGTVDSVRVLENTTNNHTLEMLAVKAVQKLRYEENKIQHPVWIIHTIHYK